jgi:pyruvate dehydrogenase E1 component alpha subunit
MGASTDAFRAMLRVRMVEEAIAERYSEQRMRNPVHLCIGQEATAVGVSEMLRASDRVMSGHRSHAHYLAKGGDLPRMLAELYGRVTGCCRGRGGSQHLVDVNAGFVGAAPILATTVPIATGVAWSLKRDGLGDIAVAYFGDGATEEGCVHEALSFASLHKLPIVFVCENNGLSTHTLLGDRQPERRLSSLASAHAMPAETVDGMDVRAVAAAAATAVDRARRGDGPTFLESVTYRFVGHVGPGSEVDMGYRTQDDIDAWADPLDVEAARLAQEVQGWGEVRASMVNEIAGEIEDAFAFAEASPFPDAVELLDDVLPREASR